MRYIYFLNCYGFKTDCKIFIQVKMLHKKNKGGKKKKEYENVL